MSVVRSNLLNVELPFRSLRNWALGDGGLIAKIGVVSVSWFGTLGAMPAMANVSPPAGTALHQDRVTAEDVALACGAFPVDAYITHDSAVLKRSFCELLAFSPFSFSSIDSFVRQVVPESLISDDSPSPEAMTLPSFWWSRNSLPRQFGSYRLVDAWTAYEIRASSTRVIDLQVNPQIWRILQYSERYGALSHLAEEARAYQYNLRLFNNNLRDPSLIGLYVCDYLAQEMTTDLTSSADTASGCIAIVDEDSIARMQASLETPEEVAQPPSDSQPSGDSVVGSNPQEDATQTDPASN